ncbi:endonuclease MutS2 [Irregularibacter muris]|uniref:Endonuclease MutS2 n=1 Tax=Irregularibacter muris TaxID=1796619 RepID=A0AAE3HEN9_9FIRM|nr:endonuclease MutS2 [Irregularibacter muris]MCR1897769.1 endonuclease MutS2 [Irregularibacter muris]
MNEKSLRVLEYFKIIEEVSQYANSPLGREKILSLRPITDLEKVRGKLQETTESVAIVLQKGRIPLEGLTDIGPFLKKAKIGSILSPGELLKIARSLKICENVKDYIKEERNQISPYPIISSIIEELVELPGLTKELLRVIIGEDELSDHASPTLHRIRKQIQGKNNALRDKLNKMIHSTHYQKYLQEPIVTLRGDRYVIPVKQEYRANVAGLIHDQSSSGATLFIEPMSIVEMNNDLKTLIGQEEEEIERILIEFTGIIENNYEVISNNFELLGKLDAIFAKGNYSLNIRGSEPLLNHEGYINFKQARHPLIPDKDVMPSDIFLGRDFHTLLITGPNTGGKTVTLKTIGLLCLMGQSGLHIPVKDGSEMAIFHKVFADIGDEQSIEQSLSTFSSHMTNIVDILDEVDERSLVLFDELGAGTDPTEGAALAMSILDFLHKKNIRTVATTHYSELKEYALSTQGIENAAVEFNIETLRPTYILQIGLPGKSNAFEISKRLGLMNEVINQAREYISQEDIQFEDLLLDIETKRKQIEEESIRIKNKRLEIENLKNQLEEKELRFNEKKDKLMQRAREEALEIVKEAKTQMDEIITELRRLEKEQILKGHNKSIENAKKQLRESENDIQKELAKAGVPRISYSVPKDLKPGDEVLITTLNQKGFVLSLPDDKDEVQIQAGIMKINVHINNLSKLNNKKEKTFMQKTSRTIKAKTISISPQLDLRGKTTEEAILDTDKYLDDAYLANLGTITIIHGKGTGALRKSIHDLLKSHTHVKDYRIGKYNEGGEGATIVSIK